MIKGFYFGLFLWVWWIWDENVIVSVNSNDGFVKGCEVSCIVDLSMVDRCDVLIRF